MRETTSGALDRLAVARLGGLVLSQLVLAGFVLTYVAVAALVCPSASPSCSASICSTISG